MAPTAMSSPYFSSEELKHTEMTLSLACMMKVAVPQCYAGQNQGRAETDVFLFQPQQGFGAGEEPQHPDTGQTLGENGGQRRAPDPHVQSVNKNRVQNDVGHRADEHRPHSDLGKALCSDKGVQAQGQLHEHGAHSVDLHIAGGVADGVLAGAEGQQQIRLHSSSTAVSTAETANCRAKQPPKIFSAVS